MSKTIKKIIIVGVAIALIMFFLNKNKTSTDSDTANIPGGSKDDYDGDGASDKDDKNNPTAPDNRVSPDEAKKSISITTYLQFREFRGEKYSGRFTFKIKNNGTKKISVKNLRVPSWNVCGYEGLVKPKTSNSFTLSPGQTVEVQSRHDIQMFFSAGRSDIHGMVEDFTNNSWWDAGRFDYEIDFYNGYANNYTTIKYWSQVGYLQKENTSELYYYGNDPTL